MIACGVFALSVIQTASATADLGPPGSRSSREKLSPPHREKPEPPPAEPAPLVFREDANATESQLIIPRRFLRKADKKKTADNLAPADNVAQSDSHTRTVIAGIALSLAAGSVVLMRRRSRPVQLLTLSALIAAGAFAAWSGYDGATNAAQAADKAAAPAGTGVIITITDKGEAVEFVHGTGATK